jgi:hypothetical protein
MFVVGRDAVFMYGGPAPLGEGDRHANGVTASFSSIGRVESAAMDTALRESVRRTALHVVLPLAIGGFVYLVWRPDSLLLFWWANSLHLLEALQRFRAAITTVVPHLPAPVSYSLPTALWAYAMVSAILVVWRGSHTPIAVAWCSLATALAVGPELAQWAGVLSGTFDFVDLSTSTAAVVIAICHYRRAECPSHETYCR